MRPAKPAAVRHGPVREEKNMKETYFVRFAVYMVAMGVMYVLLRRAGNRSSLTRSNDSTDYIVKAPPVLGAVYLVLFLFGVLLYVIFLILGLTGNPSITPGSFRFAAVISAIGLLVMLWSVRWRITVQGTLLTVEGLFRKRKTFSIYDLDPVILGSKGRIALRSHGKKIAEVDALCDNYPLLVDTLRKHEKLNT